MGDWPLLENKVASMAGVDGANLAYLKVCTTGAAHTKGNYLQLLAATPFHANGFILMPGYFDAGAATAYQYLVDVSVGAAGSEKVILPNFSFGAGGNYARMHPYHSFFPISIPAGSRLAFRAQCTSATKLLGLGIQLVGGGFSGLGGLSEAIAYGVNTGTTRGVNLDAGAAAHTKGAWVEITSGTSKFHRGFVIAIGNALVSARVWGEFAMDIGIGAAGSEKVIIPDFHVCSSDTVSNVFPNNSIFYPFNIPAGTRIAARICSDITTNSTKRKLDVMLYGIS